MKLRLRAIFDEGNLSKERLTLRAAADLDTGDYLVAQTHVASTGDPTTVFNHSIWLPFKQAQKGDLIVIYTKEGNDSESVLKNDVNMAHFFYLGLTEPIWNDARKGAIVLYTPDAQFKSQPDLRKKSR